MRNKEETKQKLIDSVSKIILRDGFAGIGINAVAKEAGADKVLIYRYFGDLDGLLKAFILRKDYFGNLREIIGDPGEINSLPQLIQTAKTVFIGQLKLIRQDRELQEILLWELNTKNKVTSAVARKREAVSIQFVEAFEKKFSLYNIDIRGVLSVLSSAVYYLVIRSRTVDVFTGLNFKKEQDWERIESSLGLMLDLVMSKALSGQ